MKFVTAIMLPVVLTAAVPVLAASENGHAGKAGASKTAAPAPLPGSASDTDFFRCDGYAAPKGKVDGISQESFIFGGTRSADIRRGEMWIWGETGVAACDRALADARLIDAFWLRRANLIQAKALHSIAANRPEQALTLTTESGALGAAHDDRYFTQSIGAGNEGVRAYALIATGRKDEAKAAIDRLRTGRPFAQSIQQLATRLQLHLDASFSGQSQEIRNVIPLSPEKAGSLFWMHFLHGNYAEARAIAPVVSFDLPKQRGGWTLHGADQNVLDGIGLRSTFYGAWAYADTVTGHNDHAASLLTEANAEVEEIMAPPQPRSDGRPPKKKNVEEYERRLPYARKAKDELALWKAAINFRPRVTIQPIGETHSAFLKMRLDTLPIAPDILMNVPQENPAEKAEAQTALASIRNRLEAERIAALDFPVKDVIALLPRPETPKVVPRLKPAGDGYFLSASGLTRDREGKSDIWTIRYTHLLAPIAAVEELAMLGAALTAKKEGYDSLLLLSRIGIARTTNVTSYYGGGYQQNSGYESQMRVRFLNASAIPQELQGMEWRLIPAQRVIDELANRYTEGGITIAW